ncbi:MAG: glycosyltransferase family 4 protein [Thermoplasmata archaeon]|nr:MAG: glycosyltransferase family 4 protein [Thermoplasmata archaeon]
MRHVCFVLHADLFTPWPIVRAMKEIAVLKEHGFKISVVSWIKGDLALPAFEERDEIKVYRFFLAPPKRGFLGRFLVYRQITRQIIDKVQELNPDAVVCHDLEILNAGVKAIKKLKVPLFYDAHENWPAMVAQNSRFEARLSAMLEKRLLKHVTHSYTYGDDLTKKFNDMGHLAITLYNSKSMNVIPNVGETEIGEMKTKLGLEKKDFIIGFAGSVNLENGTQQVMDSLKNLPDNFKFLVVGGSGREEDLENVKKYAVKKGVLDRVIFTGRVKSQDLLRYSAAFDVGTALFMPVSENQVARVPNKLFDYMAMKVPMIVSDFPNMRKVVVEESDCGIAVQPMDIQEIMKAVLHFHEDPKMAKEKGKNGRIKFETKYSWDVQKQKLMDSHPIWRGNA